MPPNTPSPAKSVPPHEIPTPREILQSRDREGAVSRVKPKMPHGDSPGENQIILFGINIHATTPSNVSVYKMREIRKNRAISILVCLSCAAASAQSVANPQFEVASIRPAASREPVAGERVGGIATFCGTPRITMGPIHRPLHVRLPEVSGLHTHSGCPSFEPDWMKESSSLNF